MNLNNPMYNNYGMLYGGQPLNNPMMGYQERMAQIQQQYNMPQQCTQQFNNGLQGKVVDSIDVVKATDIPMDGNMYYFPKADGTEIFGKQWMSNGQTKIVTFKPVPEQSYNDVKPNNSTKFDLSDESTNVLMKRFDEIEKRLDEFTSKGNPKSYVQKTRKESEQE